MVEELYARANGDASVIPWADLMPNPHLVTWLDNHGIREAGKKALKIGCGLGDDAEELARRGFDTTAFDISPTAIAWCQRRFPGTSVHYVIADLFMGPRTGEVLSISSLNRTHSRFCQRDSDRRQGRDWVS